MKLIDQTPYVDEKGNLSLVNRLLAMLKFGSAWEAEIKAQQVVVDILQRKLPKGYTLMRNITLPGTDITLPLLLVGPAGLTILLVSPLKGTFRANQEDWSEYSGKRLVPSKPNLLLLASKLARATQRYLDKQGLQVSSVEGMLLATDPGMHIESLRPVVRVVMRDAIELFFGGFEQSYSILSQAEIQKIVELLTEKPEIQPVPQPVAPPLPSSQPEQPPVQEESAATTPELEDVLPWSGDRLGFDFKDDSPVESERPTRPASSGQEQRTPGRLPDKLVSNRGKISAKQWALLIGFGLVEVLLLFVFFTFILR